MPNLSLIANSGIQLFSFSIRIDKNEKAMLFYEWYDREDGKHKMDIAYEIATESEPVYVRKIDLARKGFLANSQPLPDWEEVKMDNIKPLKIGDCMCRGVEGEIFKMDFKDRHNKLKLFENVWLPIPYFFNQTKKKQLFGPLNWSRFKLIPCAESAKEYVYDVILAFDTKCVTNENDEFNECPVLSENYGGELDYSVSKNEFFTVDYCLPDKKWSYIDTYIRKLIYPDINDIKLIKENFKCSYIASYIYLIDCISRQSLFPDVVLYSDRSSNVQFEDIDMIVDVGNSKTTALLVEDNRNFNQIEPLRLQDYTDMVTLVKEDDGAGLVLNQYDDPFDMRIAFRRANFGNIGIQDSCQFVYPSLVRLGHEANKLIHITVAQQSGQESVSTNSSPKRYLWDNKKSRDNWEFVVLPGENKDRAILKLPGITNQLNSDGSLDLDGHGGASYKYSRRSLMTFSFLEMIVQAHSQINSADYRKKRGSETHPRRLKRIIITCPTTMSEIERVALVKSARDAVVLFENFGHKTQGHTIEVVPEQSRRSLLADQEYKWYYDEASCVQFVYIYAEIAQRYGCNCDEFFKLYGKRRDGDTKESLIVGSLDIGAGTSDLMISKYDYTNDGIVSISPDPLFYDSFYYAGDDMMKMLISNLVIDVDNSKNSALRKALGNLSQSEYEARVNRFFGPDCNGQSFEERLLRRDFALQVTIPLIQFYLQLMQKDEKHRFVSYDDIFRDQQPAPNSRVLDHFSQHFGVNFQDLKWEFDIETVGELIERAFDEKLIKQIAAIMYAYSCDIVILSGRPTSLPPIERLFLKYYPVSPNRLIMLNKFQVGDWYPFNDHNGYISNPKTIVAVGAMIGYYASELANFNSFTLKMNRLGEKLKSTVNYLLNPNLVSRIREPFFLTPEQSTGTIQLGSLPQIIGVKQLKLSSYPVKSLFSIDYNRENIASGIRARFEMEDIEPTDTAVNEQVEKKILQINRAMPLRIEIERGNTPDDKEHLKIVLVEDVNGGTIQPSDLEIKIQSLGASEDYWLDTGIIL